VARGGCGPNYFCFLYPATAARGRGNEQRTVNSWAGAALLGVEQNGLDVGRLELGLADREPKTGAGQNGKSVNCVNTTRHGHAVQEKAGYPSFACSSLFVFPANSLPGWEALGL